MRRRRPLERKEGVTRDATLVVIASEDQYAVKQYFELFRSTRVQFKVIETHDTKSSPEHVMERLERFMKEFDFGAGDQFWLVCDTDHWIKSGHIANLVQVLQLCKQKGIGVALSFPCFELWLLLHFRDAPAAGLDDCDSVMTHIRDAVGSYNKARVYDLPITNLGVTDALRRAKQLCTCEEGIPDSPQTQVFRIVDELHGQGIVFVNE